MADMRDMARSSICTNPVLPNARTAWPTMKLRRYEIPYEIFVNCQSLPAAHISTENVQPGKWPADHREIVLCGRNSPSTNAGPSTPQLHTVCGWTTMYSIGPNRPWRCSIDAVPWIFTATGSMGSTEARLSTMSETLPPPTATFLYFRE